MSLLHVFGNDGSVSGQHPKKDPHHFGGLSAGFYLVEQVVILFVAKAAFKQCGFHYRERITHKLLLSSKLSFITFSYKTAGHFQLVAITAVIINSINSVCAQLTQIYPLPAYRVFGLYFTKPQTYTTKPHRPAVFKRSINNSSLDPK